MNTQNVKALILEDDAVFATLLSGVLRSVDIDSVRTSSSTEFIETFKLTKPELCLVDLNVDRLGVGFQVIEALRRVVSQKLVIFVVSGERNPEAVAHAIEIGADDFIAKPLDRDLLLKKLSRRFQNEALSLIGGGLVAFSGKELPVDLGLDFELRQVDELGVQLLGDHLVSKGERVRLRGDFVREFTGAPEQGLRVTSTSIDPVTKRYLVSLEFDAPPAGARKWILARQR